MPNVEVGIPLRWFMEVLRLAGRCLGTVMVCSSERVRQSSVRLRHMLSALRRSCRSNGVPAPIVEAALDWELVFPSIADKERASEAVASRARQISLLTTGLAFPRAVCSNGCIGELLPAIVDSGGEPAFLPCLGEEDMVVTVVVAVRGLSTVAFDIAAADDEGNFPVSSSFRILDFRSSSSSQTVDGAVVERVDSVPSSLRIPPSNIGCSADSWPDTRRLPLTADRLDWRYAPWTELLRS
jgi:hypothetical protein